jgi:ABC-type proline/glycine betaine transport system substrate-binding protein
VSDEKLLWGGIKKMKVLKAGLLLACSALLFPVGCGSNRAIRLHGGDWESFHINNAIATYILERGYGYKVENVAGTAEELLAAMEQGRIDLKIEFWLSNRQEWYTEQTRKGSIVDLGIIYEGGPQFWIIPRWVSEEYGIKTVHDMKERWQLFQDPDDPTKGLFYNCIVGWQCRQYNIVKLEAYGLDRFYNLISPGSSRALEAVLVEAQEAGRPVFAYYWAPTALMGAYDWHILEEPAYDEEVWQEVVAAVQDEDLRPLDHACTWRVTPVRKIAHRSLATRAPEVVGMLKKMVVGIRPLNETVAWVRAKGVTDWRDAALYFLRSYEPLWKTWVSPTAFSRIKESLDQEAGQPPERRTG